MTTIPASQIVAVNPAVLGAGGTTLEVLGLILSTSTRIPVGAVPSFPDADSVSDYFGGSSQEADLAEKYFAGFDGSSKKPGSVLFAQYNESDVAAWLRGGDVSGLTLAQLQAISGTLILTVDGYVHSVGALSLSAATSFSSAATLIQNAINAAATEEAEFTGAVGAEVTGSISGTTLTVTAVGSGLISVGDELSGTGGGGVLADTTIVAQLSGTTGGVGTYTVSDSQTVTSTTITVASNVLVVSAVADGLLAVGQTIDSTGDDAVITELGTGTGTVGTYVIDGDPQTIASEAMVAVSTPVVVTYDSVSGAFIVTSGVTGEASTIGYASGTTAASLKLTSATGATISQGAVTAEPDTFMDSIVGITTNWVTFMTAFDPDADDENTVKLEFAAWVTAQNNRYCYVCWDLDQSPLAADPASSSLGQLLDALENSGTCLLAGDTDAGWDATTAPELAAFVCGSAASIDFEETNGRITFAFKAQSGIAAGVTTAAAAVNLAGSPQSGDRGNGYNFYGVYGAANADFTWFQRGFVTGDFAWLDAYLNQIWLNERFQSALLALLASARSIPYNVAGNSLIEAALADPIQAGLNFGAFGPGEISASQIAQVNQDAGANIANTLQTQGWYLQVLPASSIVRARRGSPPCTFWYLDRGSVQAITLSSVAVQ